MKAIPPKLTVVPFGRHSYAIQASRWLLFRWLLATPDYTNNQTISRPMLFQSRGQAESEIKHLRGKWEDYVASIDEQKRFFRLNSRHIDDR